MPVGKNHSDKQDQNNVCTNRHTLHRPFKTPEGQRDERKEDADEGKPKACLDHMMH